MDDYKGSILGECDDHPAKCTYKLGETSIAESPHRHTKLKPCPKILPNILYGIGHTPLVKINNITKSEGVECDILAKCEFFNAGGSIKDRIGLRMVEDAEAQGKIKPGDTLIEPTAGNTGIGIAIAAAVKGYHCMIVMPEKMSKEKVDVLKALGAEIVRVPNVSWDSPDSYISIASRLAKELPNTYLLHQYCNPSNPLAHYDGTAEEILEACDGHVDMIVCGAGTGGTITGIERKIKERCPDCIIVGVDPYGSMLAQPEEINKSQVTSYTLEGLGSDFMPIVCERKYVDKWYKSDDKVSYLMARRLIQEEGLLCGASSGSIMYAALKAVKDYGLKSGQKCVIIIADSIRNYLTKFVSDEWMRERGFIPEDIDEKEAESSGPNQWWHSATVKSMNLEDPVFVHTDVTIQEAIGLLKRKDIEKASVVDDNGNPHGMVTLGNMLKQTSKTKVKVTDHVSKVMHKQTQEVTSSITLRDLAKILDKTYFVTVVQDQTEYKSGGQESNKKTITGIVTRIDLLNFSKMRSSVKENGRKS